MDWKALGRRGCNAMHAAMVAGTVMLAAGAVGGTRLQAETCTTQSQMTPADRDALAAAGRSFAQMVQSNDAAGLRAVTIPQYAQNFDGIASAVAGTAPKVKGATLIVRSVYLLDASNLKSASEGNLPTAQFYCTLNNSPAETSFIIPGLPPGRYGLVMVQTTGTPAPWQMTFVVQQLGGTTAAGRQPMQQPGQQASQGQWRLAGLVPKPLTAAGHDGVWYWTQAREYAKKGERWNASLYYQTAQSLLMPVDFVSSTNGEKLHTEAQAVRPAELQNRPSATQPFSLKGKSESYVITSVATDDALGGLDVVLHVVAADTSDPVATRQRNIKVMQAILADYPELTQAFHGLWIFADSASGNSFATELQMASINTQAMLHEGVQIGRAQFAEVAGY